MSGAFIAKRFVLKLDANVFRLVMDGIMIAAGLSMLWNARVFDLIASTDDIGMQEARRAN